MPLIEWYVLWKYLFDIDLVFGKTGHFEYLSVNYRKRNISYLMEKTVVRRLGITDLEQNIILTFMMFSENFSDTRKSRKTIFLIDFLNTRCCFACCISVSVTQRLFFSGPIPNNYFSGTHKVFLGLFTIF